MRLLGILFCLCFSKLAIAQNDSSKKLSFSGFGELYYSYDFGKPSNHEKPNFIYNHKRHNELALNLLLAQAAYKDKNIRANLGAMAGNYAQYNLATEPLWSQFIYQANIGVKVSRKNNLWLDAGIMPSHIGFESAISADCWNLTRSLLAENSPYYESGAKLTYTSKNEKWTMAGLYLNGWQKIQKINAMQRPSFGAQITYKPNNMLSLNYSNFLGSDKPDSINAFRQFHNVYLQYEPSEKFGIIAGFDIGHDKYDAVNYSTWYAPVLILRQKIDKNFVIALRSEYYSDPKQIIITTNTTNGFQTLGFSTNLDYRLNQKIQSRIECKYFSSRDAIFDQKNNNFSITSNLTFRI